jgi:hypothetical protein
MTSTQPERSCDWYHRELHELQSPFTNPLLRGAPSDRDLTVEIEHCATRREDGDALLRFTIHSPEGDVFIDLPSGVCDDLRRRVMSLTTVAEDIDGLDGYHAARYRHHAPTCDC